MGLGIGTIEASAELLGFGDHAIASNEIAIQVFPAGEGLMEEHLYLEAKGVNGPIIALVQRDLEQITLEFKQFDPLSTHNIFRSLDIGGNPVTEGILLSEDVNASVNYVDSNDVQAGAGYQYKVLSNNTNNLVRLAPGSTYADIRTAVNSVDPAEGKVIIVPSGVYIIDHYLEMVHNNTHLIMDADAEIRMNDNENARTFIRNHLRDGTVYQTLGDCGSYCSIQGGQITAPGAIDQDWTVFVVGLAFAVGWEFKNIHFGPINYWHHIELNGSQDVKFLNCQFDGIYSDKGPHSDDYGTEMIQLEPSNNTGGPEKVDMNVPTKNVLFEGCTFKNPVEHPTIPAPAIGDHSGNSGIDTEDIVIRHCHFEDMVVGVHPYEFNNTIVEYCTFHNVDVPVSTAGTNTITRYLKVTSD